MVLAGRPWYCIGAFDMCTIACVPLSSLPPFASNGSEGLRPLRVSFRNLTQPSLWARLIGRASCACRGSRREVDMAAPHNGPHQAQQQPVMENPDMVRMPAPSSRTSTDSPRVLRSRPHRAEADLAAPQRITRGQCCRIPGLSKAWDRCAVGLFSGEFSCLRSQVGSQFVNQYYTVMKSSPKYLHRFYNDNSTFTFVDPGVAGTAPYNFTAKSQKVAAWACNALDPPVPLSANGSNHHHSHA